jgi:Dolichyl-phosphate-mannose-protein mannosyltransferase
MPTRTLLAIWLAFLIHGAYYCRLIPIWEGFDEWGHYAFIEHLRLHPWTLPRTTDGVTQEIRKSVQSAPIRHEAQDPMLVFEAQQPPLYYWILSIPNRIWIGADISTRVYRLRIFSVFLASLSIPFAYLAALELFHSRRMALSVCILITVMPALMIDIARVGNESLAIALASWLILLLLRRDKGGTDFSLCFALGLGLLTKAYFLAFIPILILRRRIYSLLAALAIGGWWYGRNFRLTGTWTGEIMDVAATKLGWQAKLVAVAKVHWLAVLDSAVWTHIWTGAWSFFTLRSWMYRVFELVFAVAAIMVVYGLAKRPIGRFKVKLGLLCLLEALFAAGIGYQSLSIYLNKNIYFAPGWYFYALVVAEALLLATGLLILVGRRRVFWAMSFLVVLFAALDIYSAIFILAPHYKR